jgi:hypothetical protein
LEGFESPFDKRLNPENRWVVLANLIPWDEIRNIYLKAVPKKETGILLYPKLRIRKNSLN